MKVKFLATMAASLLVLSCQQEELSVPTAENSENYEVRLVGIIDGTPVAEVSADTRSNTENKELALQFPSETGYQAFLEKLKAKSHQERIELTNNLGLTSLQEIANIADIELETIGKEATSESDFRNKYEQYVEKYNGILISNPYDASDLSLYVPDGENLATYTINENGLIAIGNEIRKIELTNDLSPKDKSLYLASTAVARDKTDFAGSSHEVNGKKTIYSVQLMQNICLNVHIGFQKKMWYGWKRDNARDAYYFLDVSSPFQYTYWLTPVGAGAPSIQTNIPCPDMYFFSTPGTIDYSTGYFLNNCRYVQGKLYVWTDQTAETDMVQCNAVVDNVYKIQEIRRCDRNKAYTLDFYVDYLY